MAVLLEEVVCMVTEDANEVRMIPLNHGNGFMVDRRFRIGEKQESGSALENKRRFKRKLSSGLADGVQRVFMDSNFLIRNIATIGQKGPIQICVKCPDEPAFSFSASDIIQTTVCAGNPGFQKGDQVSRPVRMSDQYEMSALPSVGKHGDTYITLPLSRNEFLTGLFGVHALSSPQGWVEHADMSGLSLSYVGSSVDERPTHWWDVRRSLTQMIPLRRLTRARLGVQVGAQRKEDFLYPRAMRYRHVVSRTTLPRQAIMVCIMDIDGGIATRAQKLSLAKRYFAMSYLLLRGRYQEVECVFIPYRWTAWEVNEQAFFGGHVELGNPRVSLALMLAQRILNDRYPVSMWDRYVLHASGGDNAIADIGVYEGILRKLLPDIRHFSYIEILTVAQQILGGFYRQMQKTYPCLASRITSRAVEKPSDIYHALENILNWAE